MTGPSIGAESGPQPLVSGSGGSGDGLNPGERSGRLALANGLCKDNRDQPKADVPPFFVAVEMIAASRPFEQN
jgi:hypothetical protein